MKPSTELVGPEPLVQGPGLSAGPGETGKNFRPPGQRKGRRPIHPVGDQPTGLVRSLQLQPSGLGRLCRLGRGSRFAATGFFLARGDHHDHLPTLELGKLLDDDAVSQLIADARQQGQAQLLVGNLTTAKPQRDLAFVAVIQKALDIV